MTCALQRHLPWTLVGLVILAAATARGDEVIVSASRDTSLYENDASLSNGRGSGLFVGPNGRRSARRALLAFDVAAAVPSGARVTKATLKLYLTRAHPSLTTVSLHRVTAGWGEGDSRPQGEGGGGALASSMDATWSHRFWPNEAWSRPGADFIEEPSASSDVLDLAVYSWSGAGLVRDVQQFLDQPETNHGWLARGEAPSSAVAKRFASRESGTPPQLAIEYQPPPQPAGACCLPDGSCGISLDPGSACKGKYMGVGSQCARGVCPEPTGACCIADARGTCEIRKKSECPARAYQGTDATCDPNPCPVVLAPFVDELPLPLDATPVEGEAGATATYRIRAFQTKQKLHRDLPASVVWGYDDGTTGGYPGPTIEASRGHPVSVFWANDLRDEQGALLNQHPLPVDRCLHGVLDEKPRTVVHLHGGHVPSEYDGQPESTLLPGEETRYEYPNEQRAVTAWYHDHAVGITRLNVYMGLAGFYLIRDRNEALLGLPSGPYEIPLAIQDRSFYPDGRLRYPAKWQESFFGDNAVVNGKVSPFLHVKRGKYRFRVLNGSTSRAYTLTLSSGHSFVQIGNDGGLLPESISVREVTITPGERADLVFDFQYAAPEVILKNSARSPFPLGGSGAAGLEDILKFIVDDEPGHTSPIPVALSIIASLPESGAATSRDFRLAPSPHEHCGTNMWLINGKEWDEITEKPKLGTSEIWRFVNESGISHPMHIHSLFFQVLDRQAMRMDGGALIAQGPPQARRRNEAGWKDTVQVGPFEAVRVIARFEDYAGRFPYHCHLIEHEDHGMMRQFEVQPECGDGVVEKQFEDCDDGNLDNGDGCDSTCKIERRAAPSSDKSRARETKQGCGLRPGQEPAWAPAVALVLLLLGRWLRVRRGS